MKKRGSILLITLLCVSSFMFMFSPITNDNTNPISEDSKKSDADLNPKASDDTYEDNDIFADARWISEGWHYSLSCEDDDYYYFSANEGDLITIRIEFNGYYGDLDLELRDYTDSWLEGSNTWENFEKISYKASYAGTNNYYIRVYHHGDFNTYNLYVDAKSPTAIFSEDFEGTMASNWAGFSPDNYWHQTNHRFYTGSQSLWCGNETTLTYNKSNSYSDSVWIDNLNFQNYDHIELSFDLWMDVDYDDYFRVAIKPAGTQLHFTQKYTNNLIQLREYSGNYASWSYETFDLTFFSGFSLVDIFLVLEVNNDGNGQNGVFIDNVNITGYQNTEAAEFYNLGISTDDELVYDVEIPLPNAWNYYLGKDISHLDVTDNSQIKLKIVSINDNPEDWQVTARYWEPGDDPENTGDSDEIVYKSYKKALNQKDGTIFFIPSDDPFSYLKRIGGWYDNLEIWINEDWWGDMHINRIEYKFDDYMIEMAYTDQGILEEYHVRERDNWDQDIFRMRRHQDWDEGGDDNYDEGPNMDDIYVTVPGYDIFMVLGAIGIVSFVIVKKMKINRRK